MLKVMSFAATSAVVVGLAGFCVNVSAATLAIDLGHTQNIGNPYDLIANRFSDLVSEKSGGSIKINMFPQSQLGGEVKMLQAARMGSLDMVITAQAPLSPTIKDYMIFDIPYLFDDFEQATKVLSGPVGRKYLDMLPRYGLVGLDFVYAQERDIASNRPIRNAQDFHGMKMRVLQAPGYVKTYEALGAEPAAMAYTEVYLAMQQGVVDGGDFPPPSVTLDKFTEVSKYMNMVKLQFLPIMLVASKKKWDSYPEDAQRILREASQETMRNYAPVAYNKTYQEAMDQLAKTPTMTIIDSDRADIKKAVQGVTRQLIKDVPNGQQAYDEIQAAK